MVSELDKDNNLVWIDLEMTGLEDEHLIIEIATIVTNGDLEEIAEGPSIAINRSSLEMQNINEWSKEQHQQSGLLDRVVNSSISIKNFFIVSDLSIKFLIETLSSFKHFKLFFLK